MIGADRPRLLLHVQHLLGTGHLRRMAAIAGALAARGAAVTLIDTEPVLGGGDHEIADILAFDALGCGHMSHDLAIAAIERKGDANLLFVFARDLEAVGAPACIGMINRNSAVMTALFRAAGVAPKQETVLLHDAVDPLSIGRSAALCTGFSTKMCPDADIAPG